MSTRQSNSTLADLPLETEYGSWLRFVNAMDDLSETEQAVLVAAGGFLDNLEVTPMNKSFKMLTLQAMLNTDTLPGSIAITDLAWHRKHKFLGAA